MKQLVGILLFFGALAQAQTTFDLSAHSARNNPDQVWQLGYSANNSLAPDQFRFDKQSEMVAPLVFWHPDANHGPGPGYYPYVAFNPTKLTQLGSSNQWAVRAGEVAMEASNSVQYSLVRFVAPVTGAYKVSARFAGVHFRLSTTDVHVLYNGKSLFDADIEGYGGDPAFHKVEGSSPTAEYSGRVEMKANDTITFAVGYGKNKTNYCDTTGLFARVVLVGGKSK